MSKAYFHSLPTVLCKILGVYTVRYDNKDTGKREIENVVVMENIFYQVRAHIPPRVLLLALPRLNCMVCGVDL
jgi:hypothetical protein